MTKSPKNILRHSPSTRWGGALLSLTVALFGPSCREKAPWSASTQSEETLLVSAPPVKESPLPEKVTFNEHIQPILSENCYQCHGPDSGTRYPEDLPLRLDLAETAFEPRENGKPVIIKGDADQSLVMRLIRSSDEEEVMPPPESHREMEARDIALLERWIEEGAEYQDHWSFLPVTRPAIPEAAGSWGNNPIDPFIAAKARAAGLEPNEREAAARFYRRLTLDLTGLPPTPEDTAAFTWDKLESEVDRLLATPASAEHFSRYWLDAARYADTHGIHIDNYRSIWPYRDWVVEAFRQNMRWDQFTIEQIAGDILPSPTLDQQVATGFNRCLPTTGEGGAIAEEYDAIYAQDRTTTTSAVWLGLTLGCAACHDHKFDPVSTVDNYAFNAFFRNTPMTALDRNRADHAPSIFVPLREDRVRFAEVTSEIKKRNEELAARKATAKPDYEAWLAEATPETAAPIDSTLAIHLPFTEAKGPLKGTIAGESKTWPAPTKRIPSPFGHAPVVSTSPIDLGDLGSFSRSEQVSYGGFVRITGKPTGAIVARMNPEQDLRGWDLYLQEGKIAAHIIDSWPKAANKIVSPQPLKAGTWHHVMVTFDGTISGHQAQAIYLDGKRVRGKTDPNTVGGSIETDVPLLLGSRHEGANALAKGEVALCDFRFYRRLLTPGEIKSLAEESLLKDVLALPAEQRTKEQAESLFQHFLAHVDLPTREINKALDPLKVEESEIRKRGSATLVMQEKDEEPFAHVLVRGSYSDLGERVLANTPSALPPMPADAPRNRLGLAQWLVSEDNPLTARVTMNRLWHHLFGTGLVETVEDFGIMGARPTHPKLLDWLAAEFMESEWDHRHMVKTIVLSATYQQDASISPRKLEEDPENRLLTRGPRFRLDAEVIRDLALSASGLLVEKTGGPPVKPYQPAGVWNAVAMPQSNTRNYKEDTGENLYRRSLYTFWKRTAPHPAMEILNAPTREVFCVRRERTNTPLQAFVTLNDPQFVEAARHLATRAMKATDDPSGRIDFMSARVLSRTLDEEEKELVLTTQREAVKHFTADPAAAESFLATGESSPDATLSPPETAAWSVVASQLFNLDEALTR